MKFTTSWKKIMLLLAATMALAVGVAACGSSDDDSGGSGSGSSGGTKNATLVLDFIPGAVHAGIYEAMQKGYYEDNGINLKIIEPTSTADTLKLIDAGKADFGIADGIDLATQISDGREAQGIMALLQRPPGGLITLKDDNITDPKQLEGKTVGITGVPSDTAILNTVMKDAGGNPDDANVVTIGFNGVQSLEAGKVSAFTGFIPADGVQVEADGYPDDVRAVVRRR
ncbi:MAG TPA: ABC transporter substrate-binding protein, partial [Solirubrobacterales bacterium]|nr:ABC transporter substrate-binding protein [Solirubrobacterales bacterium]